MRRLMMLAPVVALALASANCSGGAFNSPTGPGLGVTDSATEARGGTGGGGGGKKGGGSGGGTTDAGSGSLALVLLADNNQNGLPSWRDTITFNVTTTATGHPFVAVSCYQGGARVFAQSHGFFEGYPWAAEYFLSSGAWTGGAADCRATLSIQFTDGSTATLTTLSFTAE